MPGGVPGGVKGEQGGEYRPVKSGKMDGSKRWLEFTRRPSAKQKLAQEEAASQELQEASQEMPGLHANRKVKEEGNRTKIRPQKCATTGWNNLVAGNIPGSGARVRMVLRSCSCPEAVRTGTTEY